MYHVRRCVSLGMSETSPNKRGRSRERSSSLFKKITKKTPSSLVANSRSNSRVSRTYSPRSRSRSYSSRSRYSSRSASPVTTSRIAIEKLTKNVSKQHIDEIFVAFGAIDSVELPLHPKFRVNRGLCYVTYTDFESAKRAVAYMHDAQLDGGRIKVSISVPKRSSPSRQFFRHGSPSSERDAKYERDTAASTYGRGPSDYAYVRSKGRRSASPQNRNKRHSSGSSASRSRSISKSQDRL